jgi:hypothetical protein
MTTSLTHAQYSQSAGFDSSIQGDNPSSWLDNLLKATNKKAKKRSKDAGTALEEIKAETWWIKSSDHCGSFMNAPKKAFNKP